jgi:hypothetical protein
MLYIALPSPTIRQRHADADCAGHRKADAAGSQAVETLRIAKVQKTLQRERRSQAFLDHHRIFRQRIGDGHHQRARIHRLCPRHGQHVFCQALALCGPVVLRNFDQPLRCLRLAPGTHFPAQDRQQRTQCFPDAGADGDLGRIILTQLPVALADLHHRHSLGQRIDETVHRHAQHVGAQAHQQVVGRECRTHLLLVAGERTEEGGMLGGEMRGVGHRLLVNRRAQDFGEFRRFLQRVASGKFVAGDQHRIARNQ